MRLYQAEPARSRLLTLSMARLRASGSANTCTVARFHLDTTNGTRSFMLWNLTCSMQGTGVGMRTTIVLSACCLCYHLAAVSLACLAHCGDDLLGLLSSDCFSLHRSDRKHATTQRISQRRNCIALAVKASGPMVESLPTVIKIHASK